jgi:hypothetical protein
VGSGPPLFPSLVFELALEIGGDVAQQPAEYAKVAEGEKSRFRQLCESMANLHDKKSADYGSESDPLANIRASEELGIEPWKGALLRLNDKVHRLRVAAKRGYLENESAENSFLDVAVYALIGLILYEESERTEPEA